MYLYLKALHIIFVVTWFAGLFYMPRLLIYNTEANDKEPAAKAALQEQFAVMMKRLWYGITWPSAILTLILGPTVMIMGGWHRGLLEEPGRWLLIKLVLVFFLYGYFSRTHRILQQQLNGVFKYTSMQLRMWNELATVFLICVVMLVVVKQQMSMVWGLLGLLLFIVLLMSAIKIYKLIRDKK